MVSLVSVDDLNIHPSKRIARTFFGLDKNNFIAMMDNEKEKIMPLPKPLPSVEVLNQLFEYDRETGILKFQGKVLKPDHTGYIFVKIPNVGSRPGHRIIWKLVYGKDPNQVIDHIDGDPSNNRIENLRDVSPAKNAQNRTKTSNKYLGVTIRKRESQAVITRDKKIYDLGMFETPEEARDAYLAAAKEYEETGTITKTRRPSKYPNYAVLAAQKRLC